MSVQDELNKHAQNPNDKFQGGSFNEGRPGMDEQQAMMEAVPLPGQGLTQDPESRAAWETPPEFTDLQEFTEFTFVTLSAPDKLPEMLDILRKGIPAEVVAEKVLMGAMKEGKIDPNLLMSAIEPTIYVIMALGTYGGVDVVVYPEDDFNETASDSKQLYQRKAQELLMSDQEQEYGEAEPVVNMDTMPVPPNVPKSLLQRGQQAVSDMKPVGPNVTKGEM